MKHALIGPQQIQRRQHHTHSADDDPPAGSVKRTNQDQELTNETVQPGQAD